MVHTQEAHRQSYTHPFHVYHRHRISEHRYRQVQIKIISFHLRPLLQLTRHSHDDEATILIDQSKHSRTLLVVHLSTTRRYPHNMLFDHLQLRPHLHLSDKTCAARLHTVIDIRSQRSTGRNPRRSILITRCCIGRIRSSRRPDSRIWGTRVI